MQLLAPLGGGVVPTDGEIYALLQCRTDTPFSATTMSTKDPFKTLGCDRGVNYVFKPISNCFTNCYKTLSLKPSSLTPGYINTALSSLGIEFCSGEQHFKLADDSDSVTPVGFFSKEIPDGRGNATINIVEFTNIEIDDIKNTLASTPQNDKCKTSSSWVIYVLKKTSSNEWIPMEAIKIYD